MSKHPDRMRSIGRYNYFSKNVPKSFSDTLNNDPKFKKYMTKQWKKATASIDAQIINGVEFGIEETLRFFLQQFNYRSFNHGLDSMPTSFNVMEAFYKHRPDLACFLLRSEKDYLFSMPEFIDFITNPESNAKIDDILSYMEEGVIYSYSTCNKIEDYIFSTDSVKEYAVSGVSMIRHGSEINMIMLAGEKADLKQETKELFSFEDVQMLQGRENIKPDPNRKREAVALEDGVDFWKTLVLTRFDLSDATQNTRQIMKDHGDGYLVLTDDINVFYEEPGKLIDGAEEVIKNSLAQLSNYEPLFELCKSALMLPSYFWSYNESLVTEPHQTELFRKLKKDGWPTKKKLLSPKELICQRMVSVLQRNVANSPNMVSYTSPDIKIERSGFWKRLPSHKTGKDKNGNDIHGRTWVSKDLSWFEKETSSVIITGTNTKLEKVPDGPNKGYIYAMRSASDKKDIFKIGLTQRTPEVRAKEISRGCGVPTEYFPVEEWEVADCKLAEKMIHDQLKEFRVNNNREFFHMPYKNIRKIIDDNISAINKKLS